jgi:hypothetical protein
LAALAAAAAVAATTLRSAWAAEATRPVAFGLRMNLLIDDNLTPLLNAAQVMRSDWISQDVSWRDIESAPGNYQWQKLDAVVAFARPYVFRILLSVAGTPDWARPAGADLTRDGPPADYATFANFMAHMAARYAGQVSAYELWPESNIASHWSSPDGISPERYTDLLRQTVPAIHAADQNSSIIVAGSLAPTGSNDGVNVIDDLVFYQRMYAAGAAEYFDVLGVRVDGYNNPPSDSPTASSVTTTTYKGHTSFYFRHYEDARAVMVASLDADTPLWITSAGWASAPTPLPGMEYASDVSEGQQAEYLAAALAQVQAQSYVGLILINNFDYAITPERNPVLATFSLIRSDWSARPAFVILAQLRQDTLKVPAVTEPGDNTTVHTLPNWSPRQRKMMGRAP